MGDIDARDQQHKADSTGQKRQERANTGSVVGAPRLHAGLQPEPAFIHLRMRLRDFISSVPDVLVRLSQRDSGAQPGDHSKAEAAAAVVEFLLRKQEERPEVWRVRRYRAAGVGE